VGCGLAGPAAESGCDRAELHSAIAGSLRVVKVASTTLHARGSRDGSRILKVIARLQPIRVGLGSLGSLHKKGIAHGGTFYVLCMARVTRTFAEREEALRTTMLALWEAAYFLRLSVAQAERLWVTGRLPRPVLADGATFVPDALGTRLVLARAFRGHLAGAARDEFDLWQSGAIEISRARASSACSDRSDRAVS